MASPLADTGIPASHDGTAGRGSAWETIVSSIGPKVRGLRQQLGLSLHQLAQRSDVSAAAIHKVERGEMVPTITTLLKLATALDRPIAHFVETVAGGRPEPVAVHTPASARSSVRTLADGVELTRITGSDERFTAAGAMATIAAGATGVARQRPGEDLVLVLTGTLSFEVAGERYTLRRGDALHYPTDRPHRWSNPGRGAARAVWIYVPPA